MVLVTLLVAMLAVTACSDESNEQVADRGQAEIARYNRDPLTAPVDIGLTLREEPNERPAEERQEAHPGFDAPGHHPTRIEYWFAVPDGGDRAVLLDAATEELAERGWELVVARDDLRVLTADPGVDHLKVVLVMPEPTSEFLLQEITVER